MWSTYKTQHRSESLTHSTLGQQNTHPLIWCNTCQKGTSHPMINHQGESERAFHTECEKMEENVRRGKVSEVGSCITLGPEKPFSPVACVLR